MTVGYSTTLRNAKLDANTTAVGAAGKLSIYNGTRPATGGTATTLLAQFTLGSPYAPAASGGTQSPTLPSPTTGAAAGTATWARLTTSGGTFVADMDVGTAGTEVVLNTTTISVGVAVSITSWSTTAGNP
jgi:hypothetical protein